MIVGEFISKPFLGSCLMKMNCIDYFIHGNYNTCSCGTTLTCGLFWRYLVFWSEIQVAKDPSGADINALEQHIKNLLSPSTPLFFNTLYDPYREGADFVRGYPFSLREGVPTAISHGLWLNIPDYDAPTQLVKPAERNTRYILLWAVKIWTKLRIYDEVLALE